jgi:membrane-bound lytic murein transglycosylase B
VSTAVAQWLKYCATNQKEAGSIPDGVTEFFIDINPSDRTMALGSTQPFNRNEYQEYFLGVNAASA